VENGLKLLAKIKIKWGVYNHIFLCSSFSLWLLAQLVRSCSTVQLFRYVLPVHSHYGY